MKTIQHPTGRSVLLRVFVLAGLVMLVLVMMVCSLTGHLSPLAWQYGVAVLALVGLMIHTISLFRYINNPRIEVLEPRQPPSHLTPINF